MFPSSLSVALNKQHASCRVRCARSFIAKWLPFCESLNLPRRDNAIFDEITTIRSSSVLPPSLVRWPTLFGQSDHCAHPASLGASSLLPQSIEDQDRKGQQRLYGCVVRHR